MDLSTADEMLAHLREVAQQRELRQAEPALDGKVRALKRYQQQRFTKTYADLLTTQRYEQATRFFLQELYGPDDHTRRDAQFARVVPTLTRLFPADVIITVAQLARLHAISEGLDTRMAQQLSGLHVDAPSYLRAWQTCGEQDQRQAQIDLTVAIGQSLQQLTCKPLLRQALRMMRGPATAAGLSELQSFLETGFDTFRAMRGADEFLQTVRRREEKLARVLFAANACPGSDEALGQLP